jgi:hypothetical protein
LETNWGRAALMSAAAATFISWAADKAAARRRNGASNLIMAEVEPQRLKPSRAALNRSGEPLR